MPVVNAGINGDAVYRAGSTMKFCVYAMIQRRAQRIRGRFAILFDAMMCTRRENCASALQDTRVRATSTVSSCRKLPGPMVIKVNRAFIA